MGKRGPKSTDMHLLNWWDGEFHKAFRLLRDGVITKPLPPSGFTKRELRLFIAQLKQISPEAYWLTTQRLSKEMGNRVNLARPPVEMERSWAREEQNNEIARLQWELNPRTPEDKATSREVWNDLVKADTWADLRKVCGRWARLPDVRKRGMTPFPEYVIENAAQFLSMKRNKRFPRSTYADDARIDYLARGMAGALAGRSPLTGIERLRNLKHSRQGPLWVTKKADYILPENEQYCACWRCAHENAGNVTKLGHRASENGLRCFLELAATTKVPKQWISYRNRL